MDQKFLPEIIPANLITLKKFHIHDAQMLFEYIALDLERLSLFLSWPKQIKTIDDEINFIKNCDEEWDNKIAAHYGIYRNEDNQFLGNVSCFSMTWQDWNAEIGYWLLGKFEGAGYMSEAVRALEEKLFELGFNRLIICFDPSNLRSGSIPRRLNYKYEGTLREVVLFEGEFKNLEVYSKLKSEYK